MKSDKFKMKNCSFCILHFAFAALLSACGYQFRVEGVGPTIGGARGDDAAVRAAAPRLRIPNFENKTFEPNLEIKYTTYARREFSAGSGARVVADGEPADLLLKGQIVSIVIPSLAFTLDTTLESRVTVTVKAIVEDARSGKAIWTQSATASSEFFVTDDLQFNRILQTRALEQAGRLIAGDLATRFLDHLESSEPGRQPPSSAGPAQPSDK